MSSSNQNIQRLYQERPLQESKFPGYKSKTESYESFRLDARSEWGSLMVNGTIPNHIVQVNYLTELSVEQIQRLWSSHSRRLHGKGIIARVAREITRDSYKQRPVNRVHYHYVVKDHTRTRAELKELFEAVYQCDMDRSAFEIHVFPFDEKKGGWKGYIAYFVKLKNKEGKPALFEKNIGLRKYLTIGQWWTDDDGVTPIRTGDIKKKKQRYMITKGRLRMSEKMIPLQFDNDNGHSGERADQAKLKNVLDNQTDKTLYDWYSILLAKPALFGTIPPDWLIQRIWKQPLKCIDLLKAIEGRIRYSDNPDIITALQVYHGLYR